MERSLLNEIKNKLNLNTLPKPVAIGLVAILLIGGCFAAGILLSSPTQSRVVIDSPSASSSVQTPDDPESSTIFVHVSGAVEHAGLFELESDARVAAAIEAAGGFAEDADTSSVNLARVLSDGEQLFIAQISGVSAEGDAGNNAGGSVGSNGGTASGGASQGASQGSTQGSSQTNGKININTASQNQLKELPGIGESTASKIISDRVNNGPFKKIEDLTRVSGIGDKKFEALRDLICV